MPSPAVRRSTRWKSWALNLGVAGIATVLSVLVLEFVCRLAFPYFDPRNQILLIRNEEGVVIGSPSTHIQRPSIKGEFVLDAAFNALGFRDTKDPATSTPSSIFVAGDSFSMGYGVKEEERYSSLLEKRLGVSVFNIAIPEDIRGYARTIDYAQRHGATIRHLILGLCMENDLWDYNLAGPTTERYAQDLLHTPFQRVAEVVRSRSTLWGTASATLQRYDGARAVLERLGISRNIDQLTHKNDYSPAVMSSSRDELLAIVTKYDSIVLTVPSRALWHGSDRVVEAKIHEEMVQSLRAAGVKVVDMKPRFEASGDPLSFYYKTDPHWSPRGQAAAAEALAEFIGSDPSWSALVRGGADVAVSTKTSR